MAATRRGPRPKGPFAKQLLTLTTRITRETRSKLDALAAVNGRSLSQEVELRLVRSIEEDEQLSASIERYRGAPLMLHAGRTIADATFDETTRAAIEKLEEVIIALEGARLAMAEALRASVAALGSPDVASALRMADHVLRSQGGDDDVAERKSEPEGK